MNPIIIPSPIASAHLLASVPPLPVPGPVHLADLPNPVAMATHRTNAAAYVSACLSREATFGDWGNARVFEGAVVAVELISNIPGLMNPGVVQNHLNQMNTRLGTATADMNAVRYLATVGTNSSFNASASDLSPNLRPPPHLILLAGETVEQVIAANLAAGNPAYPNPAEQDPPLPVTLMEIFNLAGAGLDATENFYGLPHVGDDVARRNAVRRCYGIRH